MKEGQNMKNKEQTIEKYLDEINNWDYDSIETEEKVFSKPFSKYEKELLSQYKF